jgi:hypothetical protein
VRMAVFPESEKRDDDIEKIQRSTTEVADIELRRAT